jgi:hypothetical protein
LLVVAAAVVVVAMRSKPTIKVVLFMPLVAVVVVVDLA